MLDCPTCDRSFKNQRAVSNHHIQAHDESIAISEAICTVCSQRFEFYHSDRPGLTCGRDECVSEYWSGNNPSERSDVIQKIEAGLQEYYSANEQHNKGGVLAEEHKEAISESLTGRNNPRWTPGVVGMYGRNWRTQRQKAIDRDESCVICGSEQIHVHHIVPRRFIFHHPFLTLEEHANTLDNLVCLCPQHHKIAESGQIEFENPSWV